MTLTVGQKVLRARLLLGAWSEPPREFTQSQLAQEIGTSPGAVGHWEKGRRTPEAENYKDLARVLGVRLDWLLGGEDPMYASGAMRPSVQAPPVEPRGIEAVSLTQRGAEKILGRRNSAATPTNVLRVKRGKRGG